MTAMEIGNRLVELCKQGKNRQAIEELYCESCVAREAMAMPGMGEREVAGKPKLLEMNDQFFEMNEIHGGEIDGPYPHDNAFICFMSLDMTPKMGPMAGQRMQIKEAARYVVEGGKIVKTEFYYPTC